MVEEPNAIAQLQSHRKGTAKVQSNLLVHVVVEAILEISDRLDHIESEIKGLKPEQKIPPVIKTYFAQDKLSMEARTKLEEKNARSE